MPMSPSSSQHESWLSTAARATHWLVCALFPLLAGGLQEVPAEVLACSEAMEAGLARQALQYTVAQYGLLVVGVLHRRGPRVVLSSKQEQLAGQAV